MTNRAIEEILRDWLPRQRWFAGKDSGAESVRIVSRRVLVDGDPSLIHLLVEVGQPAPAPTLHSPADSNAVLYQVPISIRSELSPNLDHALIGNVDGVGLVYDAAHDQEAMHAVLGWVATEADREGIAFRREPGAHIDPDAPSLVMGGEQSNTSIIFGEQTVMKLFRIVVPGLNPDLEITKALTEAENKHVAAVQGWLETEVEGVPSTLALLQDFLRTGSDGWALALTSVRDLFAEGDLHAEEVGGDFAAESERLGMATADVHEIMARTLPTGNLDADAIGDLADSMRGRLEAAVAAVPDLDVHASAIGEAFDEVRRIREPIAVQRVHGDYHLGQVMRTDSGWVLLDFEGEPGAPIAIRAALSSPLRDIAGMLRSFDYASRYLLADHASFPQLEYRAVEWADRNRDAFCVGYAKTTGRDPREDNVLLRAFELDKAVYEVVYESRNRPDWVHIPLHSIERLVAA